MNNTFPLEEISKTVNFDSNLVFRQYKLDLKASFMQIKSLNPSLKQDQIEKKLSCSSSTLQRYRNDMNVLSPYRIPTNSHKRRLKISNTKLNDDSHRERDLKRPQMTSKDLKRMNSLNLSQMQTPPIATQQVREKIEKWIRA